MKKWFIILSLVIVSISAFFEVFCHFSLTLITPDSWPQHANAPTNTTESVEQCRTILSQPFTYLGQGRQSIIFESKDGSYVIKFIKCNRFKNDEKDAQMLRMFSSMLLASDPLSTQTGVVFAHITSENEIQKTVKLIDKYGFGYNVDIDNCPFVLQKKALPAFATLKQLYKEHKIEELKSRLNQLVTLLVERAKFGIINPDGKLIRHNNVGFLEDRAVYIDIGTLRYSPKSQNPRYIKKDFARLDPIQTWLEANDPALATYLKERIQAGIESILKQDHAR